MTLIIKSLNLAKKWQDFKNFKSEIRISKFETNTNDRNSNDQNKKIAPYRIALFLNFENLDFDIFSDFGFRASNFAFLVAACPRQDKHFIQP